MPRRLAAAGRVTFVPSAETISRGLSVTRACRCSASAWRYWASITAGGVLSISSRRHSR